MLKRVIMRFWGSIMLEHRNKVLELVELQNDGILLDLGCGDGAFTVSLKTAMQPQGVVGVEQMADAALSAEAKGIKVYRSDLNYPFPLADSFCDVVTCIQVIEHLYRTDNLIKEIHRILKLGGYTIISTPNLAALHNVLCLLLGWQPFTAQTSDEVYVGNPFNPKKGRLLHSGGGHLRIFTKKALKELLEHHGFKIENVMSIGYPVGIFSPVMRFLLPNHGTHLIVKARKI